MPKKPLPKPRDPGVMLMMRLGGGVHGKSKKAQRRADKVRLTHRVSRISGDCSLA